MKNSLRKNLVKFFIVVLAICMFFVLSSAIDRKVSFADEHIAIQVEGASVRVTDQASSGIRFAARLNKDKYDALYSQYNGKVKAGMIIVPSDYIEKVGGYTLTDFKNANLEVAHGCVEQFAEVTDGGVKYYEFSMSLTNLRDGNYTRNFEGIVYIEIESETAVTGFELYDGKYYAYAERNASYARNIYSVAYETFNDREDVEDDVHSYEVDGKWLAVDEDGLAIVKSYVDGVADLEFDSTLGKIAVANKSDYYTSPFEESLYCAHNGDAYVYGAKTVLYNGKKVKEKIYDLENDATIYKSKSYGATVNSNNTITLTNVDYANRKKGNFEEKENSYVAMKGEYGIGTTVEIKGTGANIPILGFGIDNVNGWMTATGGAGLIVAPGQRVKASYDESKTANANRYYAQTTLLMFGPNRNGDTANWDTTGVKYATTGNYTPYTNGWQKNNNGGAWTITYTLVLDTDDTLILKATYKGGTHNRAADAFDTGLVWGTDITAGSIVAYASLWGVDYTEESWTPIDTTFSWTVSDNSSKGAAFNEDGTITLKNVDYANRKKENFEAKENSYVSKYGKYGIGTVVTIKGTGANIPILGFGIDNINGWMTATGGAGLIVAPGQRVKASYNESKTADRDCYYAQAKLLMFGPNRNGDKANWDTTGVNYTIAGAYTPYTNGWQKNNNGGAWTITYTLALDTDNTLILKATYKGGGHNRTTDAFDTGLVWGTDITAGSIVAYASLWGSYYTEESWTPQNTTFSWEVTAGA